MNRFIQLVLFLVLAPLSINAQAVITYDYDDAGNRISRTPSSEVASTSVGSDSYLVIYNPLGNDLLSNNRGLYVLSDDYGYNDYCFLNSCKYLLDKKFESMITAVPILPINEEKKDYDFILKENL